MEIKAIEGWPKFESNRLEAGWFSLVNGFTIWLSDSDYIKVFPECQANGATIPWLLTFIFNRFHPFYNRAAWFHDPAVGEGGQPMLTAFIDGEHRVLTWRESAQIFKAIMIYDGAPNWLANAFYQAVMIKRRPRHWAAKIRSVKNEF
jgi:hypothetical protein